VGQRGHTKGRGVIIFYMEREMRIINWEQDSLYTTE